MELRNLYDNLELGIPALWNVLLEREPYQCIRMSEMPSYIKHEQYIRGKPYVGWYLIYVDDEMIGHVNVSCERKLGIFLFEECTGREMGKEAIRLLRKLHPGTLLAEVNPANARSLKFFAKMGKVAYITYEVK